MLDFLHYVVDLLIPAAYAQTDLAGGAPASTLQKILASPIIFLVMLPVLYFLMIRPQQKRAKEQRDMLGKLVKGDEVVVTGGLAGRVAGLGEAYLTLEIAEGVQVKVQKSAVTSVLPKGTLKAL